MYSDICKAKNIRNAIMTAVKRHLCHVPENINKDLKF